jgi:hypothetical protein
VTIWRFVRSAPLTYCWLLVLLYTTIVKRSTDRLELHHLLIHRSTNIHHLETDPLYVLFSSLLWIDGKYWLPYLVLFTVFMAPAERWLGKLRWLAVGLTAHVLATYISEGLLYLAIERGIASPRLVNASDVGVSYFLVGIVGVLSYRIVRPWRWAYVAVAVVSFVVALTVQAGFTPVGHLAALLIGLCFYPLTRARAAPPWDPAQLPLVRTLQTRGAQRWRPGAAAPVHRTGARRTARR